MIIETSDNRFYVVTETGDANLAHVYFGRQCRRNKAGVWILKNPNAPRPELVRKAATRIVEQ